MHREDYAMQTSEGFWGRKVRAAVGRGLIGVLAMAAAGCGGGGTAGGNVAVRLFNGAYGQATLYLAFQDANNVTLAVSPNADFGALTADTSVRNTLTSAILEATSGPLGSAQAAVVAGGSYTLYAGGDAFDGWRGFVLQDTQAVAAGSTIGIRAIQLGDKNKTVDVFVLPGSTGITSSNQLFTGLFFNTVSSSSNTPLTVDANGYVLDAITNGSLYTVTITKQGTTTVLATVTFTANQGGYYTIAVFDTPPGSANATQVAVMTDHRS
ncbi:MAG TPA: hypothetical protein VKT78_06490 [Fimbriimonadaceae bacterium]|nr:hypothetical protein [Fimbriimonadaceae bacterium]